MENSEYQKSSAGFPTGNECIPFKIKIIIIMIITNEMTDGVNKEAPQSTKTAGRGITI